MKLVLDSNVIVSAFATRGICTSLFEVLIISDEIIISEDILREVSRILRTKMKMPKKDVSQITEYLRENTQVMQYMPLEKQICRDEDDDKILALAISNNAKIIITGDKDLLVLKKYKEISILSPKEFWKIHLT